MKELIYIGEHEELGKVLVDDSSVEELLKSGKYREVGYERVEEVVFKKYWTEERIKQEILKHSLEIEYAPDKETKKEVFKKLEKAGIKVE